MANSKPAGRLPDLNGSDELRKVVEKAYLGVFLLTANVELAEIAVTACIDAIDIEDLWDALPLCAARLALQLQRNGWEQGASNINLTTGALPTELDCVLRLPSDLRHCFVLRLLTGIALPICANVLEMESGPICASVGVAALELTRAVAPNAALSGW